jgi:hypothetical protein
MQLQTILNRVQKFKSFVYRKACWVETEKAIALEIEILERSFQ